MFKSRGRVIAIIAVALMAIAGGAAFFFLGKAQSAAAPPAVKEPEPVHPGPQYVLKERIINLADPTARRYVKVAMAIEMGGAKEKEEMAKLSGEELIKKQAEFEKTLAPWAALIDDAVLSQISSRTTAELSTPEGRTQLKADIRDSINHVLHAEIATNVFFTQFVMQ